MKRYLVYALVVFTMTSCTSWARMFGSLGPSSGGGSGWSSHTGGGGSFGGGSGGGGHK